MPLRIAAFGLSHVGRVRPKNEDTLAVEPSRGIVMVADGMGGAPGGEVASALAVQETCRGLHDGVEIRAAVVKANGKILEMARARPELSGMGTTLTVLHLELETGDFRVAHVGDSRAYRFHGGELIQLTQDHTAVADMVKKGTLSPDQAEDHPMSHILTRALGTVPEPEVDLILGVAGEGDEFLLCSDGLTKVFRIRELEERVASWKGRKPEHLVRALVDEANQRGAPDNVTAAALLVEADL